MKSLLQNVTICISVIAALLLCWPYEYCQQQIKNGTHEYEDLPLLTPQTKRPTTNMVVLLLSLHHVNKNGERERGSPLLLPRPLGL